MFEQVSKVINEDVFPKLQQRNLTVFLVGASRGTPTSIRESVRKKLIGRRYYTWFDVYYPEELFEELMASRARFDLLRLENLLAKSVHAVVIILESAGAIAELGAFANHGELCNRLVVVVDRKYRKARSFIALGPVRYLHMNTESIVIFHDLKNPAVEELGTHIRQAVRRISKKVQVDTSVANPIAAQHFLLVATYVMQPVQREALNSMIHAAQAQPPEDITAIVTSSLNILLRQQEVILQDGKYGLTKQGLERLRRVVKLEPKGREIERLLDKLRVGILNRTLRGQKTISR